MLAVLLMGAITFVGFDKLQGPIPTFSTTSDSTVAQVASAPQETTSPPQPTTQALTEAQAEPLGASTLRSLKESRLAQSMAMLDQLTAEENPAQDSVTRTSTGVSARLDVLTEAAVAPEGAANIPEPIATVTTTSDCVTELADLVRDVHLPFAMASANLPTKTPVDLGSVVAELNRCDGARLMITGHSDSNGPEIANLQMSWDRADATMTRLVSLGAKPEKLEVIGFGTRVPFSAGTAPDAPENRRVDFRVLRQDDSSG